MIFTDQEVKLEGFQVTPRFFANSLNNEEDVTTYLHCLFVYEAVTPSVVDLSKARALPQGFFDFVESERDVNDGNLNGAFVPVVICIKSKNNFIDFFRKILKSLYLYMTEIFYDECDLEGAIKSLEFIKYCSMLINDCVLPPYDSQFSVKIGKDQLMFPLESKSRVSYNESAVAILVDLRHIIDIWENLMNNKHVFLMSCDEYLLFLIIEAFKSLLFPLKWEDKVIPVLAPHLIDILDCPFPVLIGVNTSKIPKDSALERLEEKIILDIDSNIIHFEPSTNGFISDSRPKKKIKYDEILCECVKSAMSKKLQLAKTYYYSDPKRIAIIRKLELEESVADPGFVGKARKLLELDSKEEREELFVDLVKGVFFSVILEGLAEFELFMEKKDEGLYIFNKNSFKESQGFCKKCKSSAFWVGVTENSNFQQLVKYYKKYDESNVSRFSEIVKNVRNLNESSQTVGEFLLAPSFSFKDILETLAEAVRVAQAAGPEEEFRKDSAGLVIDDLKTVLADFKYIYEEPDFFATGMVRRNTLSFISSRDTIDFRLFPKIFYGKFGLIRCLSTIFPVISPESFKKLSFIKQKLETELVNGKKSEIYLLRLLYTMKDSKNLRNINGIIDQFILMNQKCPELLPAHLVFFYLEKIFESDPVHVQMLVSVEGKLGKIAKDVVLSLSAPRKDSDELFDKSDLLKSYKSLRSTSENWGLARPRI